MNQLLLLLALLLCGLAGARAQFGSFGDIPIEITSESTRMESGLAIAETNVVIRYGETAIYCDYAQYNPDTRDVLLTGNVRIYRDGRLFTAERALYNLETKVLNTADFRGETTPFRFAGDSLSTLGSNGYLVNDGVFTTSDSSKPDYYLRARTVRIYPKDRVVFSNVKLYVGRVPIFWYPYLYQSLKQDTSFRYTPGYSGTFGAYLLTEHTFPLTENVIGSARLDILSDRGVGLGFGARWGGEKRADSSSATAATESKADREARAVRTGESWGRFRSYYIHDGKPSKNETSLSREPIDADRYRISLQDRTYLTADIYSTINLNKLSDKRFLQDFEEGEFRENPNPDNVVAITKWDENYTLSLLARQQVNEDFDRTERTPEIALDLKRQPLFGTRLFYDSETSAGHYNRNFAKDSRFPDYESFRADTYHQLSFPQTYLGWLSVVPRIGARATYYGDSGFTEEIVNERDIDVTTVNGNGIPTTTRQKTQEIEQRLNRGGALFRAAVTAGVETSFKLSKAYEQVQSRRWGLDGLRHIIQPYLNASFVYTNTTPDQILQFDRFNRSTQLPPIDFPQFNTIDSLDNWSIIRLGVRNRLQTRRDNTTINWFELDTFVDVNADRPDFGSAGLISDSGTFSNVFNRLRWNPLPWLGYTLDSQLPLLDNGFTEINSRLNFLVNENLSLNLGQRLIDGNKQFRDSNLVTFGGYVRINENWGFSFNERYEFQDSVLEEQTYQIHRDLSSWVASLGFGLRDNGDRDEVSVLLSFTLKDLPNVRLPVSLDPSGAGGSGGRNR